MQNETLNGAKDFLKKSVDAGRLVHGYLFFGGNEEARRATSRWFANLLINPQGDRVAQKLLENNEHINLIVTTPDGKSIKKEQLLFLQSEIAKKSGQEGQKVYVIEQADKMSIAATNSLLKFLEEPAENVTIILLTQNKESLLPTVLSRVVSVNLGVDQSKAEVDEQIMAIIEELEQSQNYAYTWIKHQKVIKDEIRAFIQGYQLHFKKIYEKLLVDPNLEASIRNSKMAVLIQKMRALETATRNLDANMNVGLCMDVLESELSVRE